MTTKNVTVISHGAASGAVVGVLRLHKGAGVDALGGANRTVQDVFLGSGIDDRFHGVRFYSGATPLAHRRFNVKSGVSADFLVRVDVPASGAIGITIDYDTGRTTESTDAAVSLWGVDGWVRYNGHGIVLPNEGIESTLSYDGGKLRLWYSKQSGVNGDQDIYYRESTDLGYTWSAPGSCVPMHMGSFVRKGPDGLYHMLAMDRAQSRQTVDYYRSPSGDPGTWELVQANLLGLGPNPTAWSPYTREWGNVTFYYDAGDAQWKMAIGHWDSTGNYWTASTYAGASLTSLALVQRQINSTGRESDAGDLWPVSLGGKRLMFSHDAIPPGVNIPTQGAYWTADTLAGPWAKAPAWWLKMQPYWGQITGAVSGYGGTAAPDTWSTVAPTLNSQIADLSHAEADDRTLVIYEDQVGQSPPIGSLSMSTWDAPLARILDPAITSARGDDLEAEGWTFDSGYGEAPAANGMDFPLSWFRKITRFGERTNPGALSPMTIEVHASPTHGVRARRAAPAGLSSWRVTARPAQATVRFMPLRLDADAANTVLAGVWFGSDGRIHYTSGAGTGDAGAYAAGTYYDLWLDAKATTFDLWINGVRVATDAAYASAGSPAYAKVELDAPSSGVAEGHVGVFYATPYLAAAPEWAPPGWYVAPSADLSLFATVPSLAVRGWAARGPDGLGLARTLGTAMTGRLWMRIWDGARGRWRVVPSKRFR